MERESTSNLNAWVCPSCAASGLSNFYQLERVPVHSVMLLSEQEEALNFPTGNISLAFCYECGFVSNMAFDPAVQDYSTKYESTQAYSPTFSAFHRRLASGLVERFDLHGKEIVEIGCGQGEFLALLCELGGNKGYGFDPAYNPDRGGKQLEGVTFIPDYYSEKYIDYQADFVCCKMTLEHIQQTADFMNTVRRSIGDRPGTIVFFQVPNARYIFGDIAFWDVYYEHCSYFSLGSMARLFRRCHFDILDLWTDYNDQYLMIEARPSNGSDSPPLPQEDDLFQVEQEITNFTNKYPGKLDAWRQFIQSKREDGCKIVLWGGGSKGVAFLTPLGIDLADIAYAVDINPNKSGTYMAGTGQEIIAPSFLEKYQPDVVIAMNPIYRQEIQRDLADRGLTPELITVQHI